MTWQGSGGQVPPGGSDDDPTRPDWDPVQPPTAPPAAPSDGELPNALVPPPPPPTVATTPGTPPSTMPPPPQAWGQPDGHPAPGGAWGPPTDVGYAVAPMGLRYAGALPRLLAYWLDGILVGIIAGLFTGIISAAAPESGAAALAGAAIGLGVSLLYFMAFWTSSGRATPGMRLFGLEIGAAGDGRTLSMGQAAVRWVALGSWIQVLALLPGFAGLLGLVSLIWAVALLVTTVSSPTKQGLHDRFAGSAIVQPIGRDGPVVPCLILLVLLFVVLPFIAIVGLIFLGAQGGQLLPFYDGWSI